MADGVILVVGAGQAGRGVGARPASGLRRSRRRLPGRQPAASPPPSAGRARARLDRRCRQRLESTHSRRARRRRSPTRRPCRLDRRGYGPARPPASRIASSASAPQPAPAPTQPRRAVPQGDRGGRSRGRARAPHARARIEEHRAARRRLPPARDALRVAGVAARDPDDLLRRTRDNADIARDRRRPVTPRGVAKSYGFTSLVPWLTAPLWRLHPVATAYEAIKTVQAFVMAAATPGSTSSVRRVAPRWAYFAAVAAIAGPALLYSPILVEEPWAYPGATLALWLTLRAVDAPDGGHWRSRSASCLLAVLYLLAARGAVRRARLRARSHSGGGRRRCGAGGRRGRGGTRGRSGCPLLLAR